MKKLLPVFLVILASGIASAQVDLSTITSPYSQTFDGIGSGLPTGFTVRTGATGSALGTLAAFSGAPIAWNVATGAFKNFASATGQVSGTSSATQAVALNRSLGVRQVAALGDPGAAFVLQLTNNSNARDLKLSFKLQSLDITSPRTTIWRVDYGFGSAPTTFTVASATGTLTTGGSTFTNNDITVDFGSALNNRPDDIWIRIVTVVASTGSGNRPTTGIDDFSITFNTGQAPSFSTSPTSLAFGNQGVGTTSISKSFLLNYANLNGTNVNVTTAAPYTVSKAAADPLNPYSTSLSFTAAELSGTSVNIYSKFSPTGIGAANGTISVTGGGVADPTNVSVTGTGVSLNPVANNDSYSGFFGDIISGNVSTNDSDPQSLPLTFTKLTDPANGTLTFNPDGTFSYQSVEGSTSPQTFTYRATNTALLFSDATVTITLVEKPKIFISQYYEGTSVNKWIELTNPTNAPVNLGSPLLKLGLYSISGDAGNIVISGAPTQVFSLNITIPAKSSVLIGNTGNGNEVPYLTAASAAQSNNAVINFNGNDGVALLDASNNIVDAFGTGVNAKDVSYVRNQDAITPSQSFIVSDWTRTSLSIVQNAADLDDPNRLGAHVQPELPPCVSPASQPTDLTFNSVGTKTISLTFTPSVPADEFLIVRSINNSLSANPSDGVVYTPGNALGGGVVAGRIVGGSFIDNNLTPGTTYYYFIFALNSVGCDGGPTYLTANPLSGIQATDPLPVCLVPPSQPTNFTVTFFNYNVIQGTFTPAAGADEFLVIMSKDSSLSALPSDQSVYTVGDSIGGGVVIKKGPTGSFNRSSLAQNTVYYFYIFSLNSNCSGGPLHLTTAPLTGNQKTGILDNNTLNYYFGNLHSHSSYSDGNKDDLTKKPEDDYAFAKNSRRMDFLGISEHNHTQAGMRLANWQPGIVAAQNATTQNFVAMHGMEWGVISGGGHVVVYGIDSLIGWEPGEYQIFVPKSTYTGPTGLFNIINRHGLNAIATLAHPNTTDYNNLAASYNPLADSAIVGSALESGPAFSTNTTYSDPPSSLAYMSYYKRLLARGYHVGANIDHDNHNMTFGRHTRGRTVVLAPALTENDLLDAMKKMRFYASEDSAARISFTINDHLLGSSFSGNGAPQISVSGSTTSPISEIKIMQGTPGSGNFAIGLDSTTNATFNHTDTTLPHLGTSYYYIDILEEDGSRIITSPIWYTRNDSIKVDQTITFNALTSKTYGDVDFDPAATSTNATIPIIYTSSDSTIAKIVAGKVRILKVGDVTITANQAGNNLYKPAVPKSQTLSIVPLYLTVTAEAKQKVYGSADPALSFTSNTALVGSDTFTGALTREAGENVGSYLILQGTLALSNNYILNYDSASFQITGKDLLIKADNKSRAFGAPDPEFTATYTGFVNGETPAVFTTNPIFTTPATATSPVGTYDIIVGGASAFNYSISFLPGVLTITQAEATISLSGLTHTYDGTPKSATATTDPPDLTLVTITYDGSPDAPTNPGTYAVVASLTNDNYSAVNATGSLIINKINQLISFDPLAARIFGDADFGLTATGGASGNAVTYSSSNNSVASITGSNLHIVGAGSAIITASQAGNAFYNAAADVTQLLTVNKATATITLSNLSQMYDGSPKPVTATTNPPGLSEVLVTYDGSFFAPSAVGSYSVQASLDNANYSAAPVSGNLTITPQPLKVQYKNADGNMNNNEGKPYLKIVNNGTSPVPYNQLKARYWITPENFTGTLGLWIDYAVIGNSKVVMNYVSLADPRVKALGYIEYSFTAAAGSLAGGSNSGDIQSRFANSDWTTFNESNDHSVGANSSYADNAFITLYRNGVLVWGTEPAAETPVVSLKAYSQATGSTSSNTISTYLNIKNDGNVAINYNDVTARYWFTREGTSALNFWIDWAKIGNSAINGSFTAVNPPRTNANYYLEVKVTPAAANFYPLTETGNIQYRITKSDWSNFNQLNDHSYKSGAMAENSKITLYYKGVLVYGTEPAGGGGGARIAADEEATLEAESTATQVYPNPSTGNFTLVLNGQRSGPTRVTIFDSLGKCVDDYSDEGTGSLRREYKLQVAQGLYIMVITWQDHTERIKIVVN